MKRAQILVDSDEWKSLSALAKDKKTSVGGLIRFAIKKTFFENQLVKQRAEAIENIKKISKKVSITDYKDLIDDGRKY